MIVYREGAANKTCTGTSSFNFCVSAERLDFFSSKWWGAVEHGKGIGETFWRKV